MKVIIRESEWYPVITCDRDLNDSAKYIRDVPDDIVEEYEFALEAFDRAEDKLRKYL